MDPQVVDVGISSHSHVSTSNSVLHTSSHGFDLDLPFWTHQRGDDDYR